jgi:hypothetical protein
MQAGSSSIANDSHGASLPITNGDGIGDVAFSSKGSFDYDGLRLLPPAAISTPRPFAVTRESLEMPEVLIAFNYFLNLSCC